MGLLWRMKAAGIMKRRELVRTLEEMGCVLT